MTGQPAASAAATATPVAEQRQYLRDKVVDEIAAAGQQLGVLEARNGLTDSVLAQRTVLLVVNFATL